MIFKSAKVKRLERELTRIEQANDGLAACLAACNWEKFRIEKELLSMTEARDTLQAVIAEQNKELDELRAKRDENSLLDTNLVLRDRCDMQDAVLKMIAVYGEKHPECCVRIAKAAVDNNFGEPTINDEVEQRR